MGEGGGVLVQKGRDRDQEHIEPTAEATKSSLIMFSKCKDSNREKAACQSINNTQTELFLTL